MAIELNSIDLEMLLDNVEELGIKLTQEQRIAFAKYCQTFINSDPEHALEKVLAELERITHKKLQIKKTEELIQKIQTRKKWEKLLAKNHEEENKPAPGKQSKSRHFNPDQEKQIFDAAANRINAKLTEKDYQKISEIFNDRITAEASPVTKANAALLGVISVGIAGGVRIVVQYSWGNLLNCPDLNLYHGTAPIDTANKIDTSYAGGDPLGTESRAVLNVLGTGIINPSLAKLLNIDASPTIQDTAPGEQSQDTSKGPSLKPFKSPTSIDPFDES
jgi:hypothetical protein